MKRPELSVVIPTLNEATTIRQTLGSLALQEKVAMEIIVVDGGSSDATPQAVAQSGLAVRIISSRPGRSRQLNAGAVNAAGELLLFLHADSSFPAPLALRQGVDELRLSATGSAAITAGRFSLSFGNNTSGPSFGYRYMERKARLNRPGCSHGDQGFLLARTVFDLAGPFCEECDLLAQTRFADRMIQKGGWLLLTPEIVTSARRFEAEGLWRRQAMNAVIMACGAAGMDRFLNELPALYRQQPARGRLDTGLILGSLQQLIDGLPPAQRKSFWRDVGDYAGENAWQAAFFLDLLVDAYFHGTGRKEKSLFLDLYDDRIFRLLDSRGGKFMARMLVRGLFQLLKSPHGGRDGDRSAGGGGSG